MMQTGAFLHFVLALTAIVARLRYLVEELLGGLDTWKDSILSLRAVLTVRCLPYINAEL